MEPTDIMYIAKAVNEFVTPFGLKNDIVNAMTPNINICTMDKDSETFSSVGYVDWI